MERDSSSSKPRKITRRWLFLLAFSKEKLFISASILLAFLIRFVSLPSDSVINGDGVYYATLGKKLASGDLAGGISGYWSPLYSALVGISSLLFHDLEFAGRFVSVIAGMLLIVPSYYLIRNFYGRIPAYLGTVLIVIHPALLKSSVWVMTESVFTLIFTTVVLTGWYALRGGKALTFFITGFLWGSAYLTKPEAIGFVGVFLVLTVGARFFYKKISFRRYATGYMFLLLGFLICFLPYVIFLSQKTGQWTISQKIMVNLHLPGMKDYDEGLLKITDDGQLTMQDRIWGDIYELDAPSQTVEPSPVSEPASSPVFSLTKLRLDLENTVPRVRLLFKKQLKDYIPEVLPYPFIFLAIFGFFYKPWTRFRAARELYLVSFFFVMLLGYAVTVVELRYVYPLIPLLIAWAVKGIVEFSDWTSETVTNILITRLHIKPILTQVCLIIILVVLLTPSILSLNEVRNYRDAPSEEKQAGLWIKDQGADSSLVMSSAATPAFYASARHLFLPNEDFLTVLEYAKRKRVDYLVFSQRRSKSASRAFPPDENNLPPEFRLVYKDEPVPSFKILIYQIVY